MPEPSPVNLLQTLSSRFELNGKLGAGSTGIVYRAFDHQLGRDVALKTLRSNNPELFYNLKEEFRAAASIVHPNLVELHELFVHGSECFFTMELLDGQPFDRWVRQKPASTAPEPFDSVGQTAPGASSPRRWSESGTRRIVHVTPSAMARSDPSDAASRLADGAAQLVRAVSALHDAGRIHCDLKPSNILVTASGRLVVLDFGLSSPRWGQFERRGFSGTLAYAAPEQMWGGELTPAADWYSVGVVLFQALTGELPESHGQLEAAIARAWAALALESQARLPARFAHVVSELLRLDPTERPTGDTIVSILDPPRSSSSSSRTHERHFVGRTRELAALHRASLSACAGWLSAIDVHGESGIGKTELVRQFTLQAMEHGTHVARGQCRLDESVPYQALDHVIDDLSRHLSLLDKDERRTFLPDDFSILARVFPVLGRLARSDELAAELDAVLMRQRAVVALRQMLWRLCAWRPLLLWIDDANWGDAESQKLLCELLREPAPPLLLILSHRDADAPWLRPIAEAVAQARGQWIDLPIGPLDDDSCRELAERLLGQLAPERPTLARRIALEGENVPLFIGQLCRLIAETARPGEDAGEPLSLSEVIARRVAALAADERRVAELVALIDAPVPASVVTAAAGLAADERSIVSRLAQAQLLRWTGARPDPKLTSYHHYVRGAILARLDPGSRKRGHRLLASAMERFEPTIVPEILLHHWLGAEEPERALAAALRAAQAAKEKLAFAHAAALYRTALELAAPSSEQRYEIRIELAGALAAAGRTAEAGEHYLVLARQTSEPSSLHLRRLAAENFLVGGQLDEGRAVLADTLARVGLPLPRSSAIALVHALSHAVLFRLRARTPRARSGEHWVELEPVEALRTDLCSSAAKGLAAFDPVLSAYFALSSLSAAARAGDSPRAATALCLSGMMLALIGGRIGRWGQEWLDEAARIAARAGNVLLRGRVLVCQAQVEVNRGQWERALEQCEEAHRWLDLHPTAATWERNLAHMAALRALEEVGELHEAWQRAADWRMEAQNRGDMYAQTTATLYLAFAKLAGGDADHAERLARLALAPWPAAPPAFQEFYRLRLETLAELYRRRPMAALEMLAQAERILRAARLERAPMAILEVGLLRVRAELALARTPANAGRALAACEREVARLDALGRSDASGYAALSQAAVDALRGHRDRALSRLATARARFSERRMALALTYVDAAESRLSRAPQPSLAHELSLRGMGIADPQAWLAVFAPGFD
jgi:eukaryotic-like serine/threonine-protein kinase